MADLRTNYLGLELPHPFIVGASPIGDTTEGAKRAEDGGAAAIVLRSVFEEQIETEQLATFAAMESHADMSAEATHFMPDPIEFRLGPEEYLEQVTRVKKAVKIPVIASLNGTTRGGWLNLAKSIEEMGADALELNVFDVQMNDARSAEDIESETVAMVRELRSQLSIPIAVKLSPFYTSLPHVVRALDGAGANGVVLFNRFFEADVDIDKLEPLSELVLSTPSELLLRLRWLAILSANPGKLTFAVSGGVHDSAGATKAIMCGASAVQLVAAILKNGPYRISRMRDELAAWLDEKEYKSLESMRGCMNILRSPNPNVYSRANYMRVLQTWVNE